MATAQPTILVKKTDGSVVHMTLAEFEVYRREKQNTNTVGTSVSVSETAVPTDALMVPTPDELSTTTPVTDGFVHQAAAYTAQDGEPHTNGASVSAISAEAIATTTPVSDAFVKQATSRVWTKKDHESPLEEPLTISYRKEVETTLPLTYDHVIDPVVALLSFSVPEYLYSRLSSLVQSRIKDVRTDDAVVEYAVKSVDAGGLGLSEVQGKELLAAIISTQHLAKTAPAPKKEVSFVIAQDVPAEVSSPLTTTTESIQQVITDDRVTQQSYVMTPHKPYIQDMQTVASAVQVLGPVDELRRYNLDDLRRLGHTSEEMAASVLSKFGFLKEESVMLYIDGLEAWRESPVYRQYISLIQGSINSGLPLVDYIETHGEAMTVEDFLAVLLVGKSI